VSALVIAGGLLVQAVLVLCAVRREHSGKKGRSAPVGAVIFFGVGIMVLAGAYSRSDMVLAGAEVGAMAAFARIVYRQAFGRGDSQPPG
jgi:hypothetical protein